jgi:hypothetical protein
MKEKIKEFFEDNDNVFSSKEISLLARFKLYVVFAKMNDINEIKTQFELMIGNGPQQRYLTLKTGDAQSMDEIYAFMSKKYVVKRSPYAESVVFSNAKSLLGESVAEYAARLEELAKHCQFTNKEEHLLP